MGISEKLRTLFTDNFLLPLEDNYGYQVVETYINQPRKRPLKCFEISPIIKRRENILELFCVVSIIHLKRNIIIYSDMGTMHWKLRRMSVWNPALGNTNSEYEAWKKLDTYYTLRK